MKKDHRYEIMYYTTGGWLKTVTIVASTKAEALTKVRGEYKVIEIYRVRYID